MSGKPAATIGSNHQCPMCSGTTPHVGGPVLNGSPNVIINGKLAARMGDMCTCSGPPDTIVQGNPTVLINGIPIATVGSMTAHGGVIITGENNVLIGNKTPEAVTVTMPVEKIPFPKINLIDRLKAVSVGQSDKLKQAETNQQKIKELAPETVIEEDSTEVTLTTTLAEDQLHFMAKKDSLVLFMGTFIQIFGSDIPALAFKELYEDAQNRKALLIPKIIVKKQISSGSGKASFYSTNETQEVWISEQVIRDAEKNNQLRGELMIILTEEYGHYLDYLLRNHYAQTIKKDAPFRDEGAKYTYKLFYFNPIETQNQHVADAIIEGRSVPLIWDYKEEHQTLKEHVGFERQNQEDTVNNLEFYKAGFIKAHGQYGHGNIEREALIPVLRERFVGEKLDKVLDTIYLGNWLRDFSQAVDPMIVRPLSNAMDSAGKESLGETPNISPNNTLSQNHKSKIKIPVDANFTWSGIEPSYKTLEFHPVLLSVKMLTTIVELAAAKEFVHKGSKKRDDLSDYSGHLELLRSKYIEINEDTLGVYRPEEHIDNPKKLGQSETGGNRYDKSLYDKFVGYISDDSPIHDINKSYGMKEYIRSDKTFTVDGDSYLTSYEYIKKQLKKAAKKGGLNNNSCLVDFGAALHTLEDYFAHTNYTEIALIKNTEELVFPWVDQVINPTNFTYSYNKIYKRESFSKNYVILDDINRIKPSYDKINQLASYLPIVTGTFGLVDTAASVLPILNEHFFSIEIEPWAESDPDQLSFSDIFIWEILKDIDASQATNSSGTDDTTYAEHFETLLKIRSNVTRLKNWTPDFIQEAFHWITERIKILFSFSQYFILKSIAITLNDAQVLLDKDLDLMEAGTFKIGIDPSHSQLAKDDVNSPMHELSALLAVEAVNQVGEKMMNIWVQNGKIEDVYKVLDKIMRHPAESTWQDIIIQNWIKKPGNREKICEASSPSVMIDRTFHAIEHIDEALHKIDAMLVNADIIENIAALFESKTAAEKDATAVKRGIKSAISKSRIQTARVKAIQEKWDKKFAKPTSCIKQTYNYTIKNGDQLEIIAKKANTTISTIKRLNPMITDEETIFTGTIIKLPNPIK